jgi:poly(A) polymerase
MTTMTGQPWNPAMITLEGLRAGRDSLALRRNDGGIMGVMRLAGWCLLAAVGGLGVVAAAGGQARADGFQVSFEAGARDAAGRFAGGTEMRLLTAHGGKLYAGNGYWEDRPGPEGRQGAQVLVLDGPGAAWRVDHAFEERLPKGTWRDLAVGALAEATFATDGSGAPLPQRVSLLLASTWDLTGATRVFTRDDATGAWSVVTLTQDRPDPDFLPQIRSFATHRDRATGVDLVFAGEMPRGIFAGSYDPAVPGRIRWSAAPELAASAVSTGFSGLEGRLRVSSFAEANGRLYAAVGQQIYERMDGTAPSWRAVYTNPRPGHSETGLRGLTTVRTAAGGEALLAAVEGNAPRLVRVDPRDGSEASELDFDDFLARAWGMRPGYVIAAYNDMARVRDPQRGEALLIGLQAFIPRKTPIPAGHRVFEAGYGQAESGAWYLVRWPDGHYDLHEVTAGFAQPLLAVRSAAASPFPGDGDAVYLAGYDAIKAPAHNTAWIARAPLATVLGPAR